MIETESSLHVVQFSSVYVHSAHSSEKILKPDVAAAVFGTILYLPSSHANNV